MADTIKLVGDARQSTLAGGAGNDSVHIAGSANDAVLYGGKGNDVLKVIAVTALLRVSLSRPLPVTTPSKSLRTEPLRQQPLLVVLVKTASPSHQLLMA